MGSQRGEAEALREERGWACLGTAKDPAPFCLIPHSYFYPDGVDKDARWMSRSAVLRVGEHSLRIRHEPFLFDGQLMQLAQLCQLPACNLAGSWWEPIEPELAVRRSKPEEGPFLEVLLRDGFEDPSPDLEAHVKDLEATSGFMTGMMREAVFSPSSPARRRISLASEPACRLALRP